MNITRFRMISLIILFAGLFICWHGANNPGENHLHALIYGGGGQGRVIFDHQMHASKGFRCDDCHTNFAGTGKILFTTRKQGFINLEDHDSNTKCFACHNGEERTDNVKGPFNNGKGAFNDCNLCHWQKEGS